MTVWHPMAGAKEYDVTVDPKGENILNVSMDVPTGRLYANEAVENPRFGLGLMKGQPIMPTLERQTY